MPDVPRQEVTIRARHRLSLKRMFQREKATAKLFNDAYFANLYRGINTLHGSDPSTGC